SRNTSPLLSSPTGTCWTIVRDQRGSPRNATTLVTTEPSIWMGVMARHAPRPNRNVTSDVPVRPSPLDRPSQPPERAPLRSRSNAPRSRLGLESTRPGWPDAERTAFTEKPGSASRLDTPPGRSRAPSGTPAASEPYAQRLSYASTLDSGPRADGARSHAGAAVPPLAES